MSAHQTEIAMSNVIWTELGLKGRTLWENLLWRHTGKATVAESLEVIVERMKQEIVAEVNGTRPEVAECTTFSELHDHFDANELGGFCDGNWPVGPCDFEDAGLPEDDQYLEAEMEFINAAQEAVHQWLQAGGLTDQLVQPVLVYA